MTVRILTALLITAGASLAQTVAFPSSNGAGCTGGAVPGYVATATGSGSNPPCSWQTVGAASVDANTLKAAVYVSDTGTTNNIVGTTTNAFPSSYAAGQYVIVKVANTITGATQININSIGLVNVVQQSGSALTSGMLVSGGIYLLAYDGARFQLLAGAAIATALKSATTNVDVSAATAPVTGQVLRATDATHATWQDPPGAAGGAVYAADTGTANHIIVTPSPAITYAAGTQLVVKVLNSNTGATDINANGLGVKNVKTTAGNDPASGSIVAGGTYLLVYDGANFQLAGAAGPVGAGYGGTSTSAVSVGSGLKSFATQAGLAYLPGVPARATSAGSPTTFMQGTVNSYSGTTLVIDVNETGGIGTRADWNLSLIGQDGATGPAGPGGAAYAADTGTVNHIVIAPSPAITYTAGTSVLVKIANDSTGAVDINANGLGVKSVTTTLGAALFFDAFKAGGVYLLVYDGTQFQLQGTSACQMVSSGLSCGIGWITLRGTSSGYRVYNTEFVAGNDSVNIAGYLPSAPPTAGNCVQWANSGGTPGGPVVAQTATGCIQKFIGTAAPGSITASLPGDTFTDTTNHQEYVCNAPSGACTSVSAGGWMLMGAGGGGSVTMQVNGSSAVSGSGSTINVATGSGLSAAASNAGGVPTVILAPDTSVLATRNGVQLGADNTCNPSSGSPTAYTCTHSNPITGYSDGMVQSFRPDVSCTAGAITLDMDSKGSRNIYAQDGSTNLTAAQCSTTTQSLMIYGAALNGGVGGWRLLTGGGTSTGGGTVYAADSGSANAITVTAAGFTYTAGSSIFVKMNASNTGATTATINGTSKNVKTMSIQDPPADALHAGGVYLLVYDGTQLQLEGTANCAMTSTGIACTSVSNSSVTLGGSTSGATTYVAPAVGTGATQRLVGTTTALAPTAGNCTVWAASGGNPVLADAGAPCGSGSASPVSSILLPYGGPSLSFSVTAQAANAMRYWQIYVPSPGLVLNRINTWALGGGDVGNMALGIYDSTCAKFAQSTTVVGAGANGALTFPFSAVPLSAGTYYVGLGTDSASTAFLISTFESNMAGYFTSILNTGESASTYREFLGSNPSSTTGSVTTLPTSCGTRTASSDGDYFVPFLSLQ